jgi:hypothetical protein
MIIKELILDFSYFFEIKSEFFGKKRTIRDILFYSFGTD